MVFVLTPSGQEPHLGRMLTAGSAAEGLVWRQGEVAGLLCRRAKQGCQAHSEKTVRETGTLRVRGSGVSLGQVFKCGGSPLPQ